MKIGARYRRHLVAAVGWTGCTARSFWAAVNIVVGGSPVCYQEGRLIQVLCNSYTLILPSMNDMCHTRHGHRSRLDGTGALEQDLQELTDSRLDFPFPHLTSNLTSHKAGLLADGVLAVMSPNSSLASPRMTGIDSLHPHHHNNQVLMPDLLTEGVYEMQKSLRSTCPCANILA